MENTEGDVFVIPVPTTQYLCRLGTAFGKQHTTEIHDDCLDYILLVRRGYFALAVGSLHFFVPYGFADASSLRARLLVDRNLRHPYTLCR